MLESPPGQGMSQAGAGPSAVDTSTSVAWVRPVAWMLLLLSSVRRWGESGECEGRALFEIGTRADPELEQRASLALAQLSPPETA
ncbi:hypothetical protein [Microbacterium sp. CH12i]|uniref:hypothetical protein n=1 Tax=Microbacterium sp. CH12i TaxID=1479651 RepID=UPI001363F3A4|nr:hypothetical protein [Microbacterium sp. CH12i]